MRNKKERKERVTYLVELDLVLVNNLGFWKLRGKVLIFLEVGCEVVEENFKFVQKGVK